jgi:hypothetical protein
MNSNARLQRDRITFKTLRALRGLSNKEAVNGSTVSPSTIRKMRMPVKDGGTRHPQAFTLLRLLEAHGKTLDVVDKE